MSHIDRTQMTENFGGKWGWFVALGVFLLVVGAIALANVVLATVVTVIYIGVMMLFGGVAQIIHAFMVKNWGRFFFWLLSGVLYTLGALICFFNPFAAASILTFLLAFFLILAGVARFVIGVQSRATPGAGWIIFAGVITTLLGILIAIQWPVNSLTILGLFFAIDLMFQGWGWIAFGFGIKSVK